MKFYAKIKIISVADEGTKEVQHKPIPVATVIATDGDSYFALTVWGDEKIHLCKEKAYQKADLECLISVKGKAVVKEDGTTTYFNNFTIRDIV